MAASLTPLILISTLLFKALPGSYIAHLIPSMATGKSIFFFSLSAAAITSIYNKK